MDSRMLKIISIPTYALINFLCGFLPFIIISKSIKVRNKRQLKSTFGDKQQQQQKQQQQLDQKNTNNTNVPIPVMSSCLRNFLSLANCFCGGVFLATCFVGLYPSVTQNFNAAIVKYSLPHYPWESLCITAGFFIVWMLEVLVHACLHCADNNHSHSHDICTDVVDPEQVTSNHIKLESPNTLDKETVPSSSERLLQLNGNIDEVTNKPVIDIQPVISSTDHCHQYKNHQTEEGHSHVPLKGHLLGSIMLTFALGSHSIIEGLGFAMIDQFGMLLNMFFTVMIHEAICSLSLGVNLTSKGTSTKVAAILIATFSILIPLGVGIGLIVNLGIGENIVGDLVTALLQGIAAGTFIYVVFMEILQNEIVNGHYQIFSVLMMILGFCSIAALKALHSHQDSPICPSLCYNNSVSTTYATTPYTSSVKLKV